MLIGAVIFVVYLYFVNFWHVVSVIASLNLSIALVTLAIDVTAITLLAASWKILLKKPGLSFVNSFEIILVSIFGDLMIPTGSVSGEVLRISLTMKKSKLQFSEVTASVLLHRLLLGTTFGVILGVSMIWVIASNGAITPTFYVFLAMAIVFIALGLLGLYAAFNSQRFQGQVERWVPRTFRLAKLFKPHYSIEEFRSQVLREFGTFGGAVSSISRATIVASTLLLILRWFIVALVSYLMFFSLGYPVSYPVVLAVAMFISMVQLIPIGIPGLVGVIEVAMTAFFIGFGIPSDIAASATILTRLVIFWFELALGSVAASLQGVRGLATNRKGKDKVLEEVLPPSGGSISVSG